MYTVSRVAKQNRDNNNITGEWQLGHVKPRKLQYDTGDVIIKNKKTTLSINNVNFITIKQSAFINVQCVF